VLIILLLHNTFTVRILNILFFTQQHKTTTVAVEIK